MKIREILLLVTLIFVGAIVHVVHTGKIVLGEGWEMGGLGLTKSWTYDETRTIEGPLPAALEVLNGHGEVDVRGGDGPGISLKFRKKIWRRTEKEALEVSARLKFVVEPRSDRLVISTNADDFQRRNFETIFVLTVPRQTAVDIINAYGTVTAVGLAEGRIENRHGRVDVSNIAGRIAITNSYEDVEVSGIGADCSVTSKHSDVRVRSATGRLTVDHAYGKITVEDCGSGADIGGSHSEVVCRRIAGPVDIRTSYEKVVLADVGPATVAGHHAPVAAERVAGGLKVATSYEDVRAEDVRGDLDVEGKSVGVYGRAIAAKEIRIETSYENLDLGGFTGRAWIRVNHGDVQLAPVSLDYPIDVQNSYSTIRVAWPGGEAGPFEARSRGGEVKWGLAVPPSLNATNGEAVVKAFDDRTGRPPVTIRTTHGDIIIDGNPVRD